MTGRLARYRYGSGCATNKKTEKQKGNDKYMTDKTDNKKPARRPRIEEQKPLAVAKGLRAYAETGDLQIAAEKAGCHVSTIRRLLSRDAEGFGMVKKAIAAKAFELSAAAQEVALSKVNDLTGMQAAIAAKLSAQSGLELTETKPAIAIQINALGEALAEIRDLGEP